VTRAALAAVVLVLIGGCGGGETGRPAAGHAQAGHARATLVAERDALTPGDTLMLGVSFTIEKDWHLYGNTANDTGYPIRVTPKLPPGYVALDLLWPTPTRHVSPGDILDHVYEERVTLLLPVVVPGDARVGDRVELKAHLDWLACRDLCLPESADVALRLPVRTQTEPDKAAAPLFAETRTRLPRHNSTEARATREGKMVVFEAPGAEGLVFYPGTASARLANPIRDAAGKGARLTLSLAEADTAGTPVEGVLEIIRPDGISSFVAVRLGSVHGS
jgi:thiol:disulfide interchange protein DsbD